MNTKRYTDLFGSDLRLSLNASGNVHQLAGILEDAAQKLRRNGETGHTLPWFVTVCGSVNFDWRVDDLSLPNAPSEPDAQN